MATVKLLSGESIPAVGLGVYRASPGEAYEAVKSALQLGYRHVDTAQVYGNEGDVGKAVADSGLPRQDVFITSKVWLDNWGYDGTLASVKATLQRLQSPYVDLMLLHAPGAPATRADTWRALEDAKAQVSASHQGGMGYAQPRLVHRWFATIAPVHRPAPSAATCGTDPTAISTSCIVFNMRRAGRALTAVPTAWHHAGEPCSSLAHPHATQRQPLAHSHTGALSEGHEG
jgi:hypothetical protein